MARKSNFAPLPSSTLLIAIFGFFISVVYVVKHWPSFGFAFAIVFVMMFMASFISLMKADPDEIVRLENYERTHEGGQVVDSKIERNFKKMLGIKTNSQTKNKGK